MSLLCGQPLSVSSRFDASLEGSDEVRVSESILKHLRANVSESRHLISLRSHDAVISNAAQHLDSVVCWAQMDKDVEDLVIPKSWPSKYRGVFRKDRPSKHIDITLEEPRLLKLVIVSALSHEAYESAKVTASKLEAYFSEGRVLRQGDIHTISEQAPRLNGPSLSHIDNYSYRIELTEPVQQGYAEAGSTNFIVLLADPTESPMEDSGYSSNVESEAESEGFEIDEAFLATSVIQTGNVREIDISGGDSHTAQVFTANPLSRQVSPSEDENAIYIRTSDLARIGTLTGDWVVVASSDSSGKRLVRAIADDRLVYTSSTVLCAPTLLKNLSIVGQPHGNPTTLNVTIQPTPFRSTSPPLPTAESITLARIASPLTVNKAHESACLTALKTYFSQGRRLIATGDIIATPVNTEGGVNDGLDDKTASSSEVIRRLPGMDYRFNDIAYYMVTEINDTPVSNESLKLSLDVYTATTSGRLGFWFEPATTRIVESGVVNASPPNVGLYYGLEFAKRGRHLQNTLGDSQSPYSKLHSVLSASLSKSAAVYNLELSILVTGPSGCGKFTTVACLAQHLGFHLLEINLYDVIGEDEKTVEATIRARMDQAVDCRPCVVLLRHIDAVSQSTQAAEARPESNLSRVLQECISSAQNKTSDGHPVVFVATTTESSRVPQELLSSFKHEVEFQAPNETQRKEILGSLLHEEVVGPDVSLSNAARETAALLASDLADLVSRAKSCAVQRVNFTSGENTKIVDAHLSSGDMHAALEKVRASYSESIGAPKIPNVSWDDVGGLANVKTEILDTLQLPLEHPELFGEGLKRRSGILLYGPPGTGKTLLAKAVATSCSLNFFSVKGPEVLNMYIGESEANIRRIFQRARDAKPCVVFFDELDSIAPKRGNQGDSGGVMDRIVSQLLAELDGMSDGKGGTEVFVIGATNRPDLLDPALLRPGRFDRLLYLGVSSTHQDQFKILEALTRKFKLDSDLDLRAVAERCPFNYTGADLYALCSDALLNAMSRRAEEIDEKIREINSKPLPAGYPNPLTPQYYLAEIATPAEMEVRVTRSDFDIALNALVPSVSESEMEHYRRVQQQFSQSSVV